MRIVSPKPYLTFRVELFELFGGRARFMAGTTGFGVEMSEDTWRELGRPSVFDVPAWHEDDDS